MKITKTISHKDHKDLKEFRSFLVIFVIFVANRLGDLRGRRPSWLPADVAEPPDTADPDLESLGPEQLALEVKVAVAAQRPG
jgi:hypothetical protein